MKRNWLLSGCILFCLGAYAQTDKDFEEYAREQEAAFDTYVRTEEESFKAYNDSINREFGRYLAETWPDYPLSKKEPPIKDPVPPDVYEPGTPRPDPVKVPVRGEIEPPSLPLPSPHEDKRKLTPVPVEVPALKVDFYGALVSLRKASYALPALAGVDEKSVSTYWNQLSRLPYMEWVGSVLACKDDLSLNDWGIYLLINHVFTAYFPRRSTNEQVVFTVFTLNQMGYRAKIGRVRQDLFPLIAFGCNVSNTVFFRYGNEQGVIYTVVNAGHKDLTSIQTCRMEYGGATKRFDMSLDVAPALGDHSQTKVLRDKQRSYTLQYHPGYSRFLETYPCVDFNYYAEAALSKAFWESVQQQITPVLKGLTQEEAVNTLLHFAQYAFQYKTDGDQFGYEHFFFPEETIASAYSDCEDRAILFSQLVRRLLGMKVVLLYYPGRHLAAAVRFDNPATRGDYVLVDGQKYLVCDPTYIGASLGMGMPDLMEVPIEVVKLKD